MRRRQTNNVDNGIFILASPDDDKKKYIRRQINRFGSFVIPLLGLFVIIGDISMSMLNEQAPEQLKLQTLASSSATSKLNGDVKTAPYPTESSETPSKWRTSGRLTIPRRLIFTFSYNLIAPLKSDIPFNYKDPLTANVLHTIETYRKHWEASDAEAKSQSNQHPKEQIVVSFLSDYACLELIEKAEPRLVVHFQDEKLGEYKADICRIAELYINGGYYFDIDIGVLEAIDFDNFHLPARTPDAVGHLKGVGWNTLEQPMEDDIVTFATVYNRQGRLFQAFVAAMPGHPVLKKALDYMVAYYRDNLSGVLPPNLVHYLTLKNKDGSIPSRIKPGGMGVGPFTLSMAHRATLDEEWEKYVSDLMRDGGHSSEHPIPNKNPASIRYARFLYEASLEDEEITKNGPFSDIPRQDADYPKKIKWCNFFCFEGHRAYFYSRVPGSKGCPLKKHLVPPYH
mmetsp:Transcript_24558/g.53140  ORF Transcript_24558/g.53140 Transcript_24558/m.53140 type:complete len:454 (-) Transcript_24558:74-1435(-)